MELTLHLPDDTAVRLGTDCDQSRRALEALAAEEYRLGICTSPICGGSSVSKRAMKLMAS